MTTATLLLALALEAGPATHLAGPDTILVASVDGLLPDAIARAPRPRLQKLMRRGQATLEGLQAAAPAPAVDGGRARGGPAHLVGRAARRGRQDAQLRGVLR